MEKVVDGEKGVKLLKEIRENIELSSEEKKAILEEIYRKRDEKRDFNDCLNLHKSRCHTVNVEHNTL